MADGDGPQTDPNVLLTNLQTAITGLASVPTTGNAQADAVAQQAAMNRVTAARDALNANESVFKDNASQQARQDALDQANQRISIAQQRLQIMQANAVNAGARTDIAQQNADTAAGRAATTASHDTAMEGLAGQRNQLAQQRLQLSQSNAQYGTWYQQQLAQLQGMKAGTAEYNAAVNQFKVEAQQRATDIKAQLDAYNSNLKVVQDAVTEADARARDAVSVFNNADATARDIAAKSFSGNGPTIAAGMAALLNAAPQYASDWSGAPVNIGAAMPQLPSLPPTLQGPAPPGGKPPGSGNPMDYVNDPDVNTIQQAQAKAFMPASPAPAT